MSGRVGRPAHNRGALPRLPIPLPQQNLGASSEASLGRNLESEGVRDAVDQVEECADADGVLDGCGSHAQLEQDPHVSRPDFLWPQRESLEKTQRGLYLLIDRRRVRVFERRLYRGATEYSRRDRAVASRSERTLILPGDEGGEQFPLTDAPLRRSP